MAQIKDPLEGQGTAVIFSPQKRPPNNNHYQ
jgi:hypothetical protein